MFYIIAYLLLLARFRYSEVVLNYILNVLRVILYIFLKGKRHFFAIDRKDRNVFLKKPLVKLFSFE